MSQHRKEPECVDNKKEPEYQQDIILRRNMESIAKLFLYTNRLTLFVGCLILRPDF